MSKDRNKKTPPHLPAAIGAFVVVWIGILISAAGTNIFPIRFDFENTGQFGDSFGILSAIMASFAAISAFAAYQSQSEEVERLKSTEIQRDRFAYQRDFENTFFNLINLFRETVSEISFRLDHGKGDSFSGRDAISKILEILDRKFSNYDLDFGGHRDRSNSSQVREAYGDLYNEFRDALGHYFRTFYHIVRYVDESEVVDKQRYIRLLRATLSNAEMVLIGLNCAYGGGKEKLKPLVENYALLHNISSQYAESWNLTELFDHRAFGERMIDGRKLGS